MPDLMDISICRECGVDTNIEGWVNRVSHGGTSINCYTCGPCMDNLDGVEEQANEYFENNAQKYGLDPESEDFIWDAKNLPDNVYQSMYWDIFDANYETYIIERRTEVDTKYPDAKAIREAIQIIEDGESATDRTEALNLLDKLAMKEGV